MNNNIHHGRSHHFILLPPPLSQWSRRTHSGLTAPPPASDPTGSLTIRVRVYTVAHILLTSAWSHASTAAGDALRGGFIPLRSARPASDPEALHWHRASV